MSDGSVVKSGMNYSGKFQEAHDASKASIQSRISNLESGGVKGTGEGPVKVNYGEQYAREKRKKILKQNVEQVKKDIHIQQIVKGVLQVARVVFN
ncbi:putative toxin component near putative ESAT-related protein repetitive [Bacillus cereus]|nr:putative toxin component near putative ESAT-related protein repetitive [Bacillus cereus]